MLVVLAILEIQRRIKPKSAAPAPDASSPPPPVESDGGPQRVIRFFVDRPIFSTVISVVFVLAGGVAVFTLPMAQYPEVTPPTVLVTALYPGANALTVQDTVAAPIEEQVSGVEGMAYMSSRSTNDGAYNLTVTFKLGTDSDMAQVLVQNRVALALPVIPALVQNEGINVRKMSPNTLMIVNLISPNGKYDDLRLSNYATVNVKDELGRLPGVAGITYLGQRDYSLRVWLDADKMAALGLSAMDVVTAISQQNVQVAAGQIGQQPVPKGQQFQLTINTLGRLTDPEQFANIILKSDLSSPQGPAPRLRVRGRAGRFQRHGRSVVAGDGHRAAPRRGPRRTGVATIRPILHLGRQAVRGAVHLPASRLQRPGNGRRRVCQDEGAEDPLSGGLWTMKSSTTPRPSSASRSTRSSTPCATRSSWWRSWSWCSSRTGRP